MAYTHACTYLHAYRCLHSELLVHSCVLTLELPPLFASSERAWLPLVKWAVLLVRRCPSSSSSSLTPPSKDPLCIGVCVVTCLAMACMTSGYWRRVKFISEAGIPLRPRSTCNVSKEVQCYVIAFRRNVNTYCQSDACCTRGERVWSWETHATSLAPLYIRCRSHVQGS